MTCSPRSPHEPDEARDVEASVAARRSRTCPARSRGRPTARRCRRGGGPSPSSRRGTGPSPRARAASSASRRPRAGRSRPCRAGRGPRGVPRPPSSAVARTGCEGASWESARLQAAGSSSPSVRCRIARSSAMSLSLGARRASAASTFLIVGVTKRRNEVFFFVRSMKTKRPASFSLRWTVTRSNSSLELRRSPWPGGRRPRRTRRDAPRRRRDRTPGSCR